MSDFDQYTKEEWKTTALVLGAALDKIDTLLEIDIDVHDGVLGDFPNVANAAQVRVSHIITGLRALREGITEADRRCAQEMVEYAGRQELRWAENSPLAAVMNDLLRGMAEDLVKGAKR